MKVLRKSVKSAKQIRWVALSHPYDVQKGGLIEPGADVIADFA
jgi:hypothetical protein